MMAHVEIIVKDQRLKEYGLPKFATTGSAGLDLRALERVELGSGDQHAFNLGFAIALPFGSFALLAPRSSLGIRGIHLANLVGIIDSDYQGELIVHLKDKSRHPEPYIVEEGQRIAQLLVLQYHPVVWEVVDKFSYSSERGEGGFGSTGTR